MPSLQIAVCISEFSTIVILPCLHWNRHFPQVNYANVDLYSSTFFFFAACKILSTFEKQYWKTLHFIPSKENLFCTALANSHFEAATIPWFRTELFKFYGNFTNATYSKARVMLQEQHRHTCPHPIKPYITSYDGKATRHLLEIKRRNVGISQHKSVPPGTWQGLFLLLCSSNSLDLPPAATLSRSSACSAHTSHAYRSRYMT